MRFGRRLSLLLLVPFLCTIPACAEIDPVDGTRAYPNPQRFESSIKAFEKSDEKTPPAPGGIVCVGSSSMVKWKPTIQADLAPLHVIPRGFGGSMMNDALYYVDRIVTKYRPRAVVVYEGDNDIAAGITPQKINEKFKAFVAAVHQKLPDAHIYLLSIKPSPSRKSLWPQSIEANSLMSATCAADKSLTYVSIVEPMLANDGKVRTDIFGLDRLHMNAKGYALWRSVLRPILMKDEMPVEAAKASATNTPAANDAHASN